MGTHQEYTETLNPVVLELGIALFTCQIFESSLCLLLAMIRSEIDKSADFDSIYDFHSKKVTGYLITRLKELTKFSDEDEVALDLGLKKRNETVHSFLTTRLIKAIDPDAQTFVISELRENRDQIRKADSIVNRKISEIAKMHGVSLETYQVAADEYFDLINKNQSLLKR